MKNFTMVLISQVFLLFALLLTNALASHMAFAATTVHSTANSYVGISYGRSKLNYDIRGAAALYVLEDKKASQINALINTLGGRVKLSSKKITSFNKYYIGRKISKTWQAEMFYADMSKYNATAALVFNDVEISRVWTASLAGYGVKLLATIPVGQFEVIPGVGIMRARSNYGNSTAAGYIPIFSLGVKHGAFGLEFERYGHPVKNLAVDVIAANVSFYF